MRFASAACWLLLLAGCGTEERSLQVMERSDSAGIEVVQVLRVPMDTVHVLEPLVRIGSTGLGGSEHDVFQLISDLVLLPRGRVTVVDNLAARVAVFDSMGVWLFDIGREGQGPGEHRAPIYADVRGDTLFVLDALQRRLSRYSAEGSFLDASQALGFSSFHPFAAVAGGYVGAVESGQHMDPAPARGALVRLERDGESADTLIGPYSVPEQGWVITDQETGMGHMVNPPVFAIYPPWTVNGGDLIWVDPLLADIEVRDIETGEPERIVRLPYAAVPPTASDREAYFRRLQAEFGFSDDVIALERANATFAEYRPPVADVLVDEKGRLWVARQDPTARGRDYVGGGWDVIDLDGDRSSHVRFPDGFRLVRVQGLRAYGITTLPNDVQVVDVFRIFEEASEAQGEPSSR